MHVCFLIPSLSNGGAERVVANLANHWVAKGCTITVVTFAQQQLDFYELNSAITRIELNMAELSDHFVGFILKNFARVRAIRNILRQSRPNIVISFMSEANVLLALSTRGIPKVFSIGSERTFPPQTPLGTIRETLRRYTYGELDAVVAQTQKCAAWLKAHTNARRVAVIPNAVLWPMLEQTSGIDPDDICSNQRKLLLAVGRLSNEKNCGTLIDVFSRLEANHPEWDLVLIGEGPERAGLEIKIKAAGLAGRVFLPGRVGNVGAWYERADVYVMTSHFEGFPNSLAEALAHGLPAVSFDCDTGPRDIVRHEVDGLLISPGDVDAMGSALDQMMSDKSLRTQYAKRAVETRERFSVERIAGMWEKLFAEVMK